MIFPPVLLGDKLFRRGLAHEEQGLEVEVDHVVPVGLGEVDGVGAADDAGVVHQDVDVAVGRQRAGDDPGHRLRRDEVGGEPGETPARGLHRRPGFRGVLRRTHAVDVGAGLREADGNPLAQPSARAGDYRRRAGQFERIEYAHVCLLVY